MITEVEPKPDEIKAFVESNLGKTITGSPEWFDASSVYQNSFYSVSKYMPIGTIVGYKGNKIYFAPSNHWKMNGFVGSSADFICGDNKKPPVYDIDFADVVLYDLVDKAQYGKPNNYKDFAYIYADHFIVLNFLRDYWKWEISKPIGKIVGYAAEKSNKGYIYYAPADGFVEVGYAGTKPLPGEVIYTIDGMTDENAPECAKIKMDDINIYSLPESIVVAVDEVPKKPLPPKGSVDAEHFAVKYVGKQIKATYKYARHLNAVRPWNDKLPLGTIVGIKNKNICFTPSAEFRAAGWIGVPSFGIDYILDEEVDRFYSIDLGSIELLSPEDYEDQYTGTIIDDDLTPNQRFAVENAGSSIIGKGLTWTKYFHYDDVIGKVIGYKGSLICYTPSQVMIDAGFDGLEIDDITYTDTKHIGEKCYTLISASAVRVGATYTSSLDTWCFTNHSRPIKATGGMWSSLKNEAGEKWDMDWTIGTVIGYHKIHQTICFLPSKKLIEFGFNDGDKCYIGVDNPAKAKAPYYQLINNKHIAIVKPEEKSYKTTEGARYASENVGRKVKRTTMLGTWDKSQVVGTIVGYKPNGSIIWVPTDEYAAKFPASTMPDDAIVLVNGFDKSLLVHSCWKSSLELVDEKPKNNWTKLKSGGWKWGNVFEPANMAETTTTTPKKRRVRDKPWDKDKKPEPIDMAPYIEDKEE